MDTNGHTILSEDYCSYEVAKLLKEKGMDKSCFKHYVQKNNNDGTSEAVTVCTHQMAMKWLREVHNIAIDTEWEHLWYVYVKPMTANPFEDDYCQCFSAKYEEAVEAALKYSLENLI